MSNLAAIDAKFWATLVENPWTIVVHLLDILIVAYFIYRLIKALAGTKIMSLIQGVVFFIILKFVAEWIGFTTITYLMNQVITYGVIACVVIFAPEIRSGLEKFGRSTQVFSQTQQVSDEEKLVEALLKSVAYMSPRKIGALISIERTQTLQEYISTGIPLDADISSQLLINIFIPNTPLHDGAVIISGNKIATACSYLPLSESMAISKEFGTRHRAAIGLSENSDALTIVVSEETGGISITSKGEFLHDLTKENFEAILRTHLITKVEEEEHWYQKFWRKKK
ncbi:TIGR00159 family protein [Streptococcus infantarius subsp. infantarius]|uniref:diadenylate cyclase CdaA n=1 Tax=Streptococcus TaxID=1301 RepID=UPI000EE5B3DF|nr:MULTISPECIES: diadenylate cyclase CdaA [Streptococcus]MBT0897447.1 diadenylate cyclase CdaA [Streptococcus infantarius subsp. infantarius]MBT0899422.1 diadenylate cyclase CdaA [Streptococcus infantarius subsp. infantarius]MBT0903111.1 diadenylate cyclase CdaA [Streptococcus infantarius subsp. infantarius]MBT0917032.1 diadenylate cyclase CdaA [Streptococcus infantarius subsp. infantarius]MBT0931364.1 diadenylate cyclase CdaA [Streptococcus infantarius subsp. infantarius]